MQPLAGVIFATHQSDGAPDTHVNIKQTVCQQHCKTPCISALSSAAILPFPRGGAIAGTLVASLWPKMF
jgi:hypothetical protein